MNTSENLAEDITLYKTFRHYYKQSIVGGENSNTK